MPHVTMIGKKLATEGLEFNFREPATECRECAYKNACLNLEPGKRYKIKGNRNIIHECKIHDNFEVAVVEVEKTTFKVTLPRKIAVAGAMITSEPFNCPQRDCSNWQKCAALSMTKNSKYKIVVVEDSYPCPLGYNIVNCVVE